MSGAPHPAAIQDRIMDTLSVASWNINSIRFRMEIVERFLREAAPDVLCLQETKVVNQDFPHEPLRRLGYTHIAINGQRMHHYADAVIDT